MTPLKNKRKGTRKLISSIEINKFQGSQKKRKLKVIIRGGFWYFKKKGIEPIGR